MTSTRPTAGYEDLIRRRGSRHRRLLLRARTASPSYLDHAFGSASVQSQVAGVYEWHINSDEPSVLDYNTDFKTANLQSTLYAPDQFRISGHDPVIVDLALTPAAEVVEHDAHA